MIEKLRSIAVFAAVADQGSFRGAARHLGLAPSRVSETVSNLEHALGVTLLYRSTRRLSLTQDGRALHETAHSMLATVERGLDAINPASANPQGTLRITAPAFVTQTALMDRFASFLAIYPKVDLKIDFSDAPRDLIRDGFDVGIRAGWLQDSELMARNIGKAERLLVASPEYVARHGLPAHPKELELWDWIHFAMRADQTELTGPEGETVTVTGRSNVSVNTAAALYALAHRGAGVTAIPGHLARADLSRGALLHVLPAWSLKPLGLHAVWPDASRRENLTSLFVRHIAGDA